MDDNRFTRLESRVDEIKDDVADIKAEQKITAHSLKELHLDVKEYTEVVKSHVGGDEKIISEIAPIIEEFRFQQERKKRRINALKELGLKLGIPATIFTILAAATKVWLSF